MSFDPKVVPFDRSAAYMHHRAMKNLRDNNVVDALELLRRAVEHSPDNDEYKLDLAGLLSEMGCLSQSNRLLLDMLSGERRPASAITGWRSTCSQPATFPGRGRRFCVIAALIRAANTRPMRAGCATSCNFMRCFPSPWAARAGEPRN